MPSISAFGQAAQTLTNRLPNDANLVVTDHVSAVDAIPELIRLRMAGEPAFVRLILDDNFAALAKLVGHTIIESVPSYDERRDVADAFCRGSLVLNGQPQSGFSAVSGPQADTMRMVGWTADGFVVGSWTEYERLCRWLALFEPPRVVRYAGADPRVPELVRGTVEDPIVVWGPDLHPEELLLPALGLEDLHVPAIIISRRTATFSGLKAKFITLAQAREEVKLTSGVLDYSTWDPGAALAFEQLNLPLGVSSTSGAHEYLEHAETFKPWDYRSIFNAAKTVMGRPNARLRAQGQPDVHQARREIEDARPKRRSGGPLVSVVMATYNRREHLTKALDSLAAQTYQNLEIVVVNDAGVAVDDIVARYPNARLINNEVNLKGDMTFNVAIAAARGKFVQGMADDDVLFPDSVASLVEAMERSGARVVNGICLAEYQELKNGSYRTFGFGQFSVKALDPTQYAVSDAIAYGAMLWETEVLRTVGYSELSDIDSIMSTAEALEIVHLDRAVYLVRTRTDNTNQMAQEGHNVAANQEKYFAKHPRPGRPLIEKLRQKALADYRRLGAGYSVLAHPAERLSCARD